MVSGRGNAPCRGAAGQCGNATRRAGMISVAYVQSPHYMQFERCGMTAELFILGRADTMFRYFLCVLQMFYSSLSSLAADIVLRQSESYGLA